MSAPVIEFGGASFTYAGADEASVQKVSLTVEAGECVVLCGRSGCGKTTLTRLANGLAGGFWEGTRTGAVRIEGRNVDELEEWRLADHIVVIDDGRVVEEGSHELLLERKGLYARPWELQHESAGWNVERR